MPAVELAFIAADAITNAAAVELTDDATFVFAVNAAEQSAVEAAVIAALCKAIHSTFDSTFDCAQ